MKVTKAILEANNRLLRRELDLTRERLRESENRLGTLEEIEETARDASRMRTEALQQCVKVERELREWRSLALDLMRAMLQSSGRIA